MTALSMTCPHCGSPNEFFAHKIHKATAVNCSRCGKSIGPWENIVARSKHSSADPVVPRPFAGWPGEKTKPRA